MHTDTVFFLQTTRGRQERSKQNRIRIQRGGVSYCERNNLSTQRRHSIMNQAHLCRFR